MPQFLDLNENPFRRRLSQELVRKIASGELLGQLSNGQILENPSLFSERNGEVSLRGTWKKYHYSWPACGCGVKLLIRAIPKP